MYATQTIKLLPSFVSVVSFSVNSSGLYLLSRSLSPVSSLLADFTRKDQLSNHNNTYIGGHHYHRNHGFLWRCRVIHLWFLANLAIYLTSVSAKACLNSKLFSLSFSLRHICLCFVWCYGLFSCIVHYFLCPCSLKWYISVCLFLVSSLPLCGSISAIGLNKILQKTDDLFD